jgi:hypothetical protein
MNTFTTITNVAYYETLKADAGEGDTNWTINRHAKRGGQVLLYVCAPVSAIVAVAEVSDSPEREDDPTSEFIGLYFSNMHGLRMLAEPITRNMLLAAFPAWGYWKQPRTGVKVPVEYTARLTGMRKELR